MLEARMDCTWKYEVVNSQLLALAQLLKMRIVDDRQKRLNVNGRCRWNADGFHGYGIGVEYQFG